MSEKISLMSAFNADLVIERFTIPPSNKTERAIIKFVFRMLDNGLERDNTNIAIRNKIIADTTFEHLEFRYALYQNYVDEFFPEGHRRDLQAMATAILCAQFTERLNEPLFVNTDPDIPTPCRNDGISHAVAERALRIWNDSLLLERKNPGKNPATFSRESLFVAHINAFDLLEDIREAFDRYSHMELDDILNENFPAINAFICKDTSMGKELKKAFDVMTKRIWNELAGTATPANSNIKSAPLHIPSPDNL